MKGACTDPLAVLLGVLGAAAILFGVFALPVAWFVYVFWMQVPLWQVAGTVGPLAAMCLWVGILLFRAADRRCKRVEAGT